MSIIFFHTLLFIFLGYSNGVFFLKKLLNLKDKRNFFETTLIGLIISITIAQFVNFFIPLNDYVILLNIIFLIIYFFLNKEIFIENLHIKKNIFILSFLIMVINIYGSGFSDDLDHYHNGFIANADTFKFIWGQSFLQPWYGTSSAWLIGHSFFNFENFRLQDIHILNGLILFLVLGLLLTELDFTIKKDVFYSPILFSLVIFILLKYTRLKEFGIDKPASLIFCFLIYYYLKYFLKPNNKEILKNFILVSLISIFIFSIKITYLPVLFFPLYIFLKDKIYLIKFDITCLIIIFPCLVFILKNFLGTGCLFFPLEISCIESVSWSNLFWAKELSVTGEFINKSWASYTGNLSESDYVKNFNWVDTWLERSRVELLEIFLTILLILLLTFFSFNFRSVKNCFFDRFKNLKIILATTLIFSISIFFLKNPVVRMNHHLLISMMTLIIIIFFRFDINVYRKSLINFFIIICLVFNVAKNFERISKNGFNNDPKLMISEKISQPIKKNVDNFVYYIGWYGPTPIGNQNLDNNNYKKIWIFDILFKK